MDSEPASPTVSLAVSLRTDRDQFIRRTCPSCGRDFKTEADPAHLQWALETYCRPAGLEIGESRVGDTSAPPRLRCPYCGHDAPVSESLAEETAEYLKRIAYQEIAIPMMNRMFSGLQDSIGSSRHSGGMFSLSVEFKHTPMTRPVRPIHGPEPPDLKIVEFLCCGKRIKISDEWTAIEACSFCGTEVALI